MFLTVPSLSSAAEEKFIKIGEVPGDGSLLELDPRNSVFYVGGVPPDFKVGKISVLYMIPFNALFLFLFCHG